jgi:hypothetical protein
MEVEGWRSNRHDEVSSSQRLPVLLALFFVGFRVMDEVGNKV